MKRFRCTEDNIRNLISADGHSSIVETTHGYGTILLAQKDRGADVYIFESIQQAQSYCGRLSEMERRLLTQDDGCIVRIKHHSGFLCDAPLYASIMDYGVLGAIIRMVEQPIAFRRLLISDEYPVDTEELLDIFCSMNTEGLTSYALIVHDSDDDSTMSSTRYPQSIVQCNASPDLLVEYGGRHIVPYWQRAFAGANVKKIPQELWTLSPATLRRVIAMRWSFGPVLHPVLGNGILLSSSGLIGYGTSTVMRAYPKASLDMCDVLPREAKTIRKQWTAVLYEMLENNGCRRVCLNMLELLSINNLITEELARDDPDCFIWMCELYGFLTELIERVEKHDGYLPLSEKQECWEGKNMAAPFVEEAVAGSESSDTRPCA